MTPDYEFDMWAHQALGSHTPQVRVTKFYGQESVMAQLEPFLERNDSMPPTLLLGEPGMGKTRLARYIATKRMETFESIMCPVKSIYLPSDTGTVLFDEIHLLKQPEGLFSAMEARTHTIIGATTQPQKIDPAFKSRFVLQLHLKPYSIDALKQIIKDELLDITEESLNLYASASAGNPRQALRIAETARLVGTNKVNRVLATCRITADGITDFQMDYLMTLSASPMGLTQVATLMYSDEDSIRTAERFLISKGLVDLTSSGRKLSSKGQQYVEFLKKGSK